MVISNCNYISQYDCIFDQINAVLLSLRSFFQKQLKYLTDPKRLMVMYCLCLKGKDLTLSVVYWVVLLVIL